MSNKLHRPLCPQTQAAIEAAWERLSPEQVNAMDDEQRQMRDEINAANKEAEDILRRAEAGEKVYIKWKPCNTLK